MPIERNEHANVRVWNIWPNDVKWERRIYCSFTKLQMTTLHSLEFEFLPFESLFEELTFVVVLKIVWFKFTSIHKKFKMQVPMRTSSNCFNEIQTYILSLCLFAEYNNRGRGSGLRYTCSMYRTSPTKNAPTRQLIPKSISVPICVSE